MIWNIHMLKPWIVAMGIGCAVWSWVPTTLHAAGDKPAAKGGVVTSVIHFFSKIISPADGDRCDHRPTCSVYGAEAFAKFGALKGWIMTCDRLLRCGGDDRFVGPTVVENGRRYAVDPLDANDFWPKGKGPK